MFFSWHKHRYKQQGIAGWDMKCCDVILSPAISDAFKDWF